MTPSTPKELNAPLTNQKGITALNVAIAGVVLVGMAAFAIDVGHALVTQNELQNAADAAALGAGRQLGVTYLALPVEEQRDLSRSLSGTEQSQITAQATAAAGANKASDVSSLSLAATDFEFGTWDLTARTFVATVTRPNAVRVTVRRDGAQNGAISTFFAGVLGVNEMDVRATSIAALGTAGGPSPPGVADVPFAISTNWFNGVANCNDGIQFSPTGVNGCAGWHVFDQGNANANVLRNTVDGLNDGSYTSPGITPGHTQFDFTGGEVSSAFPELIDLWNAKKSWNSGNARYEWEINLPVYQSASSSSCGNPSGPITIAGFARAIVTVVAKNDIQAEVQCDAFYDSAPNPNQPPGGGNGIVLPLSPYPRLVS